MVGRLRLHVSIGVAVHCNVLQITILLMPLVQLHVSTHRETLQWARPVRGCIASLAQLHVLNYDIDVAFLNSSHLGLK
jgi:hypothetical protein